MEFLTLPTGGVWTEFLTPLTGGVQNSWHVSSEKFLDIIQSILCCPSLHSLLVVIIDKIFFYCNSFSSWFWEGYRVPDAPNGRGTYTKFSPFSPCSNNWLNLFYRNSFSSWFREGYIIPDTSVGRGTEFLTHRMGGVQNSWPLDWRILYPPGPINEERPLKRN